MKPVLKNTVAVIAGVIAASIVMMAVEGMNGKVLYPELAKAAEGVTDREALKSIFAAAPVGALLVVIVGWVLGGVAGGWVATRLSAAQNGNQWLIVGVLLTLLGIVNNLMLPPPVWFWLATILVFIPAAWAGSRLAGK